MKKKICVVTGSRAEYGLLYPLLREIAHDGDLELQLIVTGMHLSHEFGLTFKEIEADGFVINKKIEILLSSDSTIGVSKSMGLALISFGEAYSELKPDLILVLGDRFEILSAVSAALISCIPVAHISGGELTEGAFDDAIRHAITKMSHLHFTATEEYRKRVIQLGEEPDRVFNVGEIGLDNLRILKLLNKQELEKRLNFKFSKKNILVTFHPATLEKSTSKQQFHNLLAAIDELKETQIIFTMPNADTNGRVIVELINNYVEKNRKKAISFVSMGKINYLSALQFVDAVVGNSSSGIVEAPSFKIGTINIGDRQKGRIRASSVIDCKATKTSISKAFDMLYSREFLDGLENVTNPYGEGRSAKKAKEVLKFQNATIKKHFYDIEFKI